MTNLSSLLASLVSPFLFFFKGAERKGSFPMKSAVAVETFHISLKYEKEGCGHVP